MRGTWNPGLRIAILVLTLGVLAAACGDQVRTTGSGSPPPAPEPGDLEPVLQVEHVGGFLPVGAAFSQVPQLTVYPDGQAVTHGPQIMIFPGPALPNLLVHDLTDEQVESLRRLAADAGLLASPPAYGDPPVADAATTVVTLRLGDDTIVHEAYALGIGEGPQPRDVVPGLDAQENQARQALSEFIEAASALVTGSGEGTAYEPQAFAVLARAVPADEPPPEPGLEPDVVPWPVSEVDLATVTEQCVVVDGQAADQLRAVLRDATQLTRFEQAGEVHDVFVRPLLPHEKDCPEVRPARP